MMKASPEGNLTQQWSLNSGATERRTLQCDTGLCSCGRTGRVEAAVVESAACSATVESRKKTPPDLGSGKSSGPFGKSASAGSEIRDDGPFGGSGSRGIAMDPGPDADVRFSVHRNRSFCQTRDRGTNSRILS